MHILHIVTESCGEAWIEALRKVYNDSYEMTCETSSSQIEENTKDVTGWIVVKEPLHPFRIHQADMFGIASVIMKKDYVKEVLHGTLDHRIGKGTPYTYHDRLFKWKASSQKRTICGEEPAINQIQKIADKLKQSPNSRRCTAITWRPYEDLDAKDPPCLQRIQFRVNDGKLDMFTHWRSRDLFKAWGANTYAMVELQLVIANTLDIGIGSYSDFCNSLHIYSKDFEPIERIFKTIEKKSQIQLKKSV